MSDVNSALIASTTIHLIDGLTAITIFIGVPWLILHYVARFRGSRQLGAQDGQALQRLSHTAARMEQRMITLEGILDAEVPNWRLGDHHGVDNHETT